MAAYNDVTNDLLINKKTSDTYRNNWENIFGKKEKEEYLQREIENSYKVDLDNPFKPFLAEEIPLNVLEEEV